MVRKLIILAILIGCTFLPCVYANSEGGSIPQAKIKDTIVKHSMEVGVDPALALSIAKKESGLRHELKSNDGAVGVFQVMPSTARRMGYNPYYLSENILCALKYYKLMYKKFGSVELALAAYNAGPGNVMKYNGMPPFKGTQIFVNKIMADYKNLKKNPDPAIARYSQNNAVKPAAKKPVEQVKAEEVKVNPQKQEDPALELVVEELIIEPAVEETNENKVKKQRRFKKQQKEKIEVDDMLTMKSLPIESVE